MEHGVYVLNCYGDSCWSIASPSRIVKSAEIDDYWSCCSSVYKTKCNREILMLLYLQDELDIQTSNVIYIKGCIEQGEAWFQQYMIPVAGGIVGAAVVLVRLDHLHTLTCTHLNVVYLSHFFSFCSVRPVTKSKHLQIIVVVHFLLCSFRGAHLPVSKHWRLSTWLLLSLL